jgi:hypothetical protein
MEIVMKTPTSIASTAIALAAAFLLTGATAASATGMQSSGANPSSPQDTLTLSQAQQKTAWQDLYTGALNQPTPAGFDATVGAAVPNSVATAPVTAKAASDVPALRPYSFAMLQNKLVIVNPSDHKIARVIAR